MFGADRLRRIGHDATVLSHAEFLGRLEAMKVAGETRNADLARVTNLPTSRIAECFKGTRLFRVDEMKAIVDHYAIGEAGHVNAETLEPLLDAILPLAPAGRLTEQSRRALAESLAYGLELLSGPNASTASSDAISVAARAAAARFRETDLAA